MNKICTSLEQSEKLIELGIDVNTADMYWDYDVIKHEDYPMVMDEQFDDCCIPAWSLSALLEMLPEGFLLMDNQGECIPILYSVWVPGFKQSHFWKPNLVDAVFEMVCWLKENGKI